MILDLLKDRGYHASLFYFFFVLIKHFFFFTKHFLLEKEPVLRKKPFFLRKKPLRKNAIAVLLVKLFYTPLQGLINTDDEN